MLDYCGGAGGKTLAFAPFMRNKGQIFVHDIRKSVLLEAKRRLRRAGVQNCQFHWDKQQLLGQLKKKVDWVVCDVPCSGSGTIRRHPELKWKFSVERLEELMSVQQKILNEAAMFVRSNGRIVYITCSLLEGENMAQVLKFNAEKGFEIENGEVFQTFPKSDGMDGFFAVTLKKI